VNLTYIVVPKICSYKKYNYAMPASTQSCSYNLPFLGLYSPFWTPLFAYFYLKVAVFDLIGFFVNIQFSPFPGHMWHKKAIPEHPVTWNSHHLDRHEKPVNFRKLFHLLSLLQRLRRNLIIRPYPGSCYSILVIIGYVLSIQNKRNDIVATCVCSSQRTKMNY
jgi:hypothetical protein